MQRIVFILAMLAGTLHIQAQTYVKGTLQDSLTHEGEPYATVRIYGGKEVKAQSKIISTALTDMDGHFTIPIKEKGDFTAFLSSTGKNTVTCQFTVGNEKEINLGIIFTTDKESMMKAMDVVAAKPIVKMEPDKVSYSVEDDAESRTLTVLDMLRKVPMVTVDGQDNITVNGQSSFKVYVDGKPNMMLSNNPSQIFKAMPASMVSSIEVVTSPGAKYDAEGAGGILNINMAKMNTGEKGQSMNGFNGSVHANGGNRNTGIGANISGQQDKFSYSADFEYMYNTNKNIDLEMLRTQQDGTTTDYKLNTKNNVPIILGNIGLGYEFSPLSQLNASFGIERFSSTTSDTPFTKISGSNLTNSIEFSNLTRNEFGQTEYNASIDFQQYLDKTKNNNFTIIYQTSFAPSVTNSETTDFNTTTGINHPTYLINERFSDGDKNTQEHIVQTDVVNKVAAHNKLNYGVKYAFRRSTSDMDYFTIEDDNKVFDEANSTDYEHRNQIGAAYMESENSWEKWSAKAGLRYEHTWQEVCYHDGHGTNFKTDYGNLVPSATLSHTMKTGQNIGLTYNMRISRPGITYLNPYVDRSEPTSITYGNSDLEVEKSHNIGLTYNLYTQKLVFSTNLKETIINGGIEQYSFFDNKGLLNTTFGNIVNRRLSTLNAFAQWSMTKSTRVILNGAVSYNYLTSDKLNINHKGWSANGMLNIQQTLPKKWTTGLSVICNTKTLTLQGYTSGYNLGMITLGKSLLRDRLNLNANGIIGLAKGGKLHIEQYAEGKDFTSSTNISIPIARFTVNVRWTFGNTGKQFKDHKSKVQSDYIEHKSNNENIGNTGM